MSESRTVFSGSRMEQSGTAYRVKLARRVQDQLRGIEDARVRHLIVDALERLKLHPNQQGKPLRGEFAGYRSLRVVGQRYRVIYKVDGDRVVVYVVFLGLRRQGSPDDVYEQAKKLLP